MSSACTGSFLVSAVLSASSILSSRQAMLLTASTRFSGSAEALGSFFAPNVKLGCRDSFDGISRDVSLDSIGVIFDFEIS